MTDPRNPRAEITDRRNPLEPERTVSVLSDRIEVSEAARLVRRIALADVAAVRLTVEPAGRETQVVCRVTGPSGEIAFGSRSAKGAGWTDNALEFRAALVALHRALEPRWGEVAFLEGQTLGFRLAMTAAGVAVAAAAAGFAGYMMIVRESALLGLIGLPFAVAGGYLAWLFRPGRPAPYDPAGLVKRFGG
ncbi:MAG: hypothetical protein ACOC05_08605 [Oceanicaulis sp.]